MAFLLAAVFAVISQPTNAQEAPKDAPKDAPKETWQTTKDQVYAISDPQGIVIGKQSEKVRHSGARQSLTRVTSVQFSIDGHEPISQDIAVSIARDGNTGAPLALSVRIDGTRTTQLISARFQGNTANFTHRSESFAGERRFLQELEPGVAIHDPEWIGIPAPRVFYAFDTGAMRLVKRTSETVLVGKDAQGTNEAWLTYDAATPANIWLTRRNAQGDLIEAIKPQVGSRFTYRPLAKDEPSDRARLATIGHPMLDSPNAISQSAKQGHIRYRIALLGPLAKAVPQTPEQRVEVSGDSVRIDVCTRCGSGLASDAASLQRWRSPSRWIQSDFPAIAELGARMAQREASDAHTLRHLARLARRRLKDIDLNGHYSARSAWMRRAGDCTEDAVLLAALARAAGIPARVASGLAYTRERYHGARDAFIPHAWVIAYLDGEWRSFDMTTKEGFGAGHIALTIGDGAAHEIAAANLMAGMIEWRTLSEVRKRPAD